MKNSSLQCWRKTKQIIVLSIIFLCFSLSTSSAQTRKIIRVQKPSGNYEMLTSNGETQFPFELIRNQIVIPVEMNGSTLKLIFDSGMPADGVILFGNKRIDDLKFKYVGKAPVKGVGGKAIEADLAMGETINFPGMQLQNQMVIVMPEDSIRSLHFEGRDGIIGFSLLSRFVVKVDYDSMRVTLVEAKTFQYTGSGEEHKITIANNRIFLPVTIKMNQEVSISGDLVVDTGNSAALTLNARKNKDIVVPEKSIVYTARSINETFFRFAGRIPNIQLGSITFDNVLCSFKTHENEPAPPWEKEGNLGHELLRRFNLIFDIANERIIFEPNHHLDEPFEFNMAGFQFIRTQHGNLEITYVISNSPASQSNLENGDQIISINGKPSNQYTYDELDDIFRLENEIIKLVTLHAGEEKEVIIELRRLI